AASVRHHPMSPRANDFSARLALQSGDLVAALRYTVSGLRLSPNEPGFHIDLHLVLALIAAELESDVARTGQAQWLTLPGMDERFELLLTQNRLHLRHSEHTADLLERLLRE